MAQRKAICWLIGVVLVVCAGCGTASRPPDKGGQTGPAKDPPPSLPPRSDPAHDPQPPIPPVIDPLPPSLDPQPPLPGPPDPTPPESPFAAIDRILEGLPRGSVAFNTPDSIKLDDTALVHLLLDLNESIEELETMIRASGETEGAQIRISDRMEARLSGSSFAITAITPETQAVSGNERTEWKWEITPTREGRQELHLTLSALLQVDGMSTPRKIRTFDKMIEVEVTLGQRAGAFFAANWQWLWAAILVPVVGWLWRRKKGKGV